MWVWPGAYVEQQSNQLMPHSGFVLHKLHKFILCNKFPVSPSPMWSCHLLYVISSKRNLAGFYTGFPGINHGKGHFSHCKVKLCSQPLYPVSTWNSSAPNQSPTMFEKADEQLYSAGTFFLISSAMYLCCQLFSFISHKAFPETTCGNSTLTWL